MKIYFQKKDFNIGKELNNFSKKNLSFLSVLIFLNL